MQGSTPQTAVTTVQLDVERRLLFNTYSPAENSHQGRGIVSAGRENDFLFHSLPEEAE